jgi:uncharacterized protein (TIGR03083 family)
MSDSAGPDLAALYQQARLRLMELASGLDAAELATAVPACPGWAVRDVIAHLTAVAEDAVAGKLAGPPSDEVTAAQIARLADVRVPALLDRWTAAAPQFEHRVGTARVWAALIDVTSHEQDVRGALGTPGARDSAAVRHCTTWLLSGLRVPVPLLVATEDGSVLAGPRGEAGHVGTADPGGAASTDGRAGLTLSTSRFEAFRWRMGRRSRAQLAAMRWSGDPAEVLGHLSVFGPATDDVDE